MKTYRDSLCRPLEIIFNDFLVNGIFPSDWKKGNIVTVKKDYKLRLNSYRHKSLLPMCSQILDRLIFNEIFGFFTENDLFSEQ